MDTIQSSTMSMSDALYSYWALYVENLTTNESLIDRPIYAVLMAVLMIVGVIGLILAWKKSGKKGLIRGVILPDPTQPRFRKRDKMMFYSRKLMRTVKSSIQGGSGQKARVKGRRRIANMARRIFRLRREAPQQLLVKEPSQAFLEEDISVDESEMNLPLEVIYMLKSIRVFGLFEKPLFLELCKQIEFVNVPKGGMLFSIGDTDDSIYVVQSGHLQVYLTEPDGYELVIKEVYAGDSIASLLSVMEVLTGHKEPFKTVSARAEEDSTLLKLHVEVFKSLLEKYPDSLLRVAQVIMVRLQRVTFTALHNYLGLTTQLMIPYGIPKRSFAGINTQTPGFHPPHHQGISISPTKSSPSSRAPLVATQSLPYPDAQELRSILKQMANNDNTNDNPVSEANEKSESGRSAPLDIPNDKAIRDSAPRQRSLITFSPSSGENKGHRRRRSLIMNEVQMMDEAEIHRRAVEGIMEQLEIDDDSIIADRIQIKEHGGGVCLVHEEAHEESALYYVLSGTLLISQKTAEKDEENLLFITGPGEFVGALAVLTGESSVFTIRTRNTCRIALIKRNHIYEIMAKYPRAVLKLSHTIIKRLSPFVRQIDFALDWIHYESGKAIYRQGDKSDCMHIVLSGRLRSVITRANGKKELIGEFGKSDLVGVVEVITQTPRSTTVMAVRDSEVAKLPDGLLEAIKIKYPMVVTRLIRLLGQRILGSIERPTSTASSSPDSVGLRTFGSNFSTVALLAVNDEVPLEAFCTELFHALSAIGPALHLTADFIKKSMGPTVFDKASEYRLSSWLGQQEDQHRIVIYQCDPNFSPWTQRCIRQADCILIVANAFQEPTVGKVEKQLESLSVRTQKELVLLHREDTDKPRNTVKWLNIRSWCASHHHIRCPERLFKRTSPARFRRLYSRRDQPPDIHSDFSRLARFLTGTSIGLVLGGGGARGAAHVGMIKAIQEAGVPIDMVGGVSIGAFMGALWCQELNVTTFIQKARHWSYTMTSKWRQILDLTYPTTAMFTGAAFNKTIYDVFGERQIEDLWLPYFTVTTDITSSSMRIHRHGSLWRYVRSSMSLSGYLPPLCDPIDGHLLLDGGYVNNLPADVMRDVMGAETILAIDVGSQDDSDMFNYGDALSGWWTLWLRWNPLAKPVRVPSLPEIQSRLAYVSCVRQLEQVKQSDYCTYIRPPIDRYKTLQFGSFDEIMDVGYNHGKALFLTLDTKSLANLRQLERHRVYANSREPMYLNQPSITDLAAKIVKIKTPKQIIYEPAWTGPEEEYTSGEDDDHENYDDYQSEPDYRHIETETDRETDRDAPVSKMTRKSSFD